MEKINLLGEWKLFAFKENTAPQKPEDLSGNPIVTCVPSNVETALISAGLLPDVYEKQNVEKARAFELYDWWYVKDFTVESISSDKDCFLVFDGVDTFAEYYLNGVKIGSSDNMSFPSKTH